MERIIRAMDEKQIKQQKLNENWERYQIEKAEMAEKGIPIGTFSAWQFDRKLVDITIPKTKEEHFGK